MRIVTKYTPTATSPVNLATGTIAAPSAGSAPRYARSVTIQSPHSATVGLTYVMEGVAPVGRVPAISTDFPYELTPATSTVPGSTYEDTDPAGGIDVNTLWIDVAVSSTPVRVSIDFKI